VISNQLKNCLTIYDCLYKDKAYLRLIPNSTLDNTTYLLVLLLIMFQIGSAVWKGLYFPVLQYMQTSTSSVIAGKTVRCTEGCWQQF